MVMMDEIKNDHVALKRSLKEVCDLIINLSADRNESAEEMDLSSFPVPFINTHDMFKFDDKLKTEKNIRVRMLGY